MRVDRPGLVLIVAWTVLLTGCGGLAGETTPTPTVTAADVPDRGTPSMSEPLPSGVSATGIADPFALARAHHDALADRSYTTWSVLTVRYANGSLRGQRRTQARVSTGGHRFSVRSVTRGPQPPFRPVPNGSVRSSGRSVFWSDGNRLLAKTVDDGETRYFGLSRDEYEPERWASLAIPTTTQELHLTFNAVETEVAGRTDRGESTLVRLRSTGRAKPGSAGKALSVGAAYQYPLNADLQVVSSVELTALVDSDGIVHEYQFSYVATVDSLDGSAVRVSRRVRYSSVGNTTVDRPDWYQEALAATGVTGGTTARRTDRGLGPDRERFDARNPGVNRAKIAKSNS